MLPGFRLLKTVSKRNLRFCDKTVDRVVVYVVCKSLHWGSMSSLAVKLLYISVEHVTVKFPSINCNSSNILQVVKEMKGAVESIGSDMLQQVVLNTCSKTHSQLHCRVVHLCYMYGKCYGRELPNLSIIRNFIEYTYSQTRKFSMTTETTLNWKCKVHLVHYHNRGKANPRFNAWKV